jgi:nicotinamidase/pyrazinamidase
MKKALIVVDVQVDFLPGGALGVDHGDEIIPVITELIRGGGYRTTIATGDYHPRYTKHFDRWVPHCVKGTPGANIHGSILALADHIVLKGLGLEDDGYSGFEGEEYVNGMSLDRILESLGITDVDVVGLTTDWCVLYTAVDAIDHNYNTRVLRAAVRPVDEEAGEEALETMKAAGVVVV